MKYIFNYIIYTACVGKWVSIFNKLDNYLQEIHFKYSNLINGTNSIGYLYPIICNNTIMIMIYKYPLKQLNISLTIVCSIMIQLFILMIINIFIDISWIGLIILQLIILLIVIWIEYFYNILLLLKLIQLYMYFLIHNDKYDIIYPIIRKSLVKFCFDCYHNLCICRFWFWFLLVFVVCL